MKSIVIFTSLFILHLVVITQVVTGSPFSALSKVVGPDRKCMICKFSVSLVNYALKTRRGYDEVDKIANNFCAVAHIESSLVCSNVSKLFNREITKVLSYGIITPDQVCGLLSNNTCGTFHNPLEEWEVNLNVSAVLNNEELLIKQQQQQQIDKQLEQSQKPYKVIHISDTHVDLKYKQGSPAVCEEPFCCQRTSTPINGSQAKANYWGTYGPCDVPLRTLESALRTINSTLNSSSDIEYIVWTGDIQPHDVWAQSKKSAVKVYDAVFAKIFDYLPNIKIFPTLGNHEMAPVDSFSPSSMLSIARDDSPEWLYKKLDSFWSHWLPSDTVNTITKDGFYSTNVRKGLKVVSLNTNFCHTRNFWLYINSTDPGNQLQWLIHELQISELLHEKVHIIGHIPPGGEDCLKVWSKNYNKIIRRFSKIVTGQFFGHTHNSEFEVFYDYNNEDNRYNSNKKSSTIKRSIDVNKAESWTPISVGFIGPSITTFIDLNPSFRVYNIDPNLGFMPIDFETYFMNLTLANERGPIEPKWESAGLFSQRFGTNGTSPISLHNLLADIANELGIGKPLKGIQAADKSTKVFGQMSTLSVSADDRLYQLYRLYNSYSDKFTRSTYDKISIDDKSKFLCRFFTSQSYDLRACKQFIRDKGSLINNIVVF